MNAVERPDNPSRGKETHDVLAKLARDAASGDERSFGRLAARVRPRIYRWALAGTGDPDEAEDVTQEVLLRLHRYLGGFEGRSRFDTWLYRITANAVASARGRAERKHGRFGQQLDSALIQAEAGDLDRRIAASRVVELVRVYLERLPARQRAVFDLVDLQGYAPRDVAEMMRMNPNTVRAHLFKARKTIRGHIMARHAEQAEGYAG